MSSAPRRKQRQATAYRRLQEQKISMITLENLDEVFSFHKWTPDQVKRGNAIRAAAKELARAILLSAPEIRTYEPIYVPSRDALIDLARRRREAALEMVSDCVMKANAAITFEAATLSPDDTWDKQLAERAETEPEDT